MKTDTLLCTLLQVKAFLICFGKFENFGLEVLLHLGCTCAS